MSKKYVSVLKDSAATPGYRIIAPEDYVYTENGTKKVKKIDSKADKKVPATAGNLATLDSTGNLADSGKQTTDFMNALNTAYEASGSATKTVTKVTQATTGAVAVTYSDIQSGTTSQKGLVQLEDSTSSTSVTKAATPNSVKSAYDLAAGKYSKPSGGIPSSDMDSAVQASLGKADTAIQGVKLNGSTLTPSSAKVVDLGNLKTTQTAKSDPSASGTTITAIATISQDANGVITATKKTIQSASQSRDGVMSAADKTKLDGIATGAEVNQNAFSNVKVGDVTVAADAKTDTLTLVAGSNVTITPDATNDKITIAAKDTTYTADAGIKLDGTVFKHTNSVSGGTVGPTTDTAGATLSVPYVTYDSQGHVTASGTRTHNVGTASTSGAGIVQLQDSIDATTTKAATPNAVKKAIEALDVSSVGGSGKYISAISESDGKISATATSMDTTPTAGSENAVTSGGIKTALDGKQNTLPTTGTASDTYAINVSGKAYQLRSIEVKSPQSDKCWAKIAESTNNTTSDYHIAFSVHNDGYAVKSAYIGILSASIQQSNQGTAGRYAVYFYRADAVEFDAIKAVLVNTGTVLELWVCNKRASQYIYFTPLHSLRLSPVYGQDRVYTQDEFDAYISGKSYYPSVEKGINRSGTDAVGSSSIPVWVDANGTLTQCTDDFVHDGDVVSTYSSSSTAPISGKGVTEKNLLKAVELDSSDSIDNLNSKMPVTTRGTRYLFWGPNSVTGTFPGEKKSFQLSVLVQHQALTYLTQELWYTDVYNSYHYIRKLVNGTWQDWKIHWDEATSSYSSSGTQPVNGTAVASAISSKSPSTHTHSVKINGTEKTIAATGGTAVDLGTYAPQFSLGSLGNTAPYTMFARMGMDNQWGNGEAQIIISSVVSYGDVNMGTWLVTVSNRGSTPSSPKATMVARCINRNSSTNLSPEFGYYYDTTNSYIYFGIHCPSYRGNNTITVLSNQGALLQSFGNSDTAPTGWTTITYTEYSLTTHTHGNIQSGGILQTNDITIANGDKLVVTDASDSNKVARTSLSFDGSTTSKALTQKGTFENVMLQADAMTVTGGAGVDVTYSGSTVTFAANITSIPTATINALV